MDEKTREMLLARARQLARRGQAAERRAVGEPVAVVLVGKERMGLPVVALNAVMRVPQLTKVPGLPDWMPGVVQVRGRILTVVDLAIWLGLPPRAIPAYLAMLEEGGRPLGLLVDGVAGVREIYADELTEQRSESALPVRFTTRDLLAVLDMERVYQLVDRRGTRPAGLNSGELP